MPGWVVLQNATCLNFLLSLGQEKEQGSGTSWCSSGEIYFKRYSKVKKKKKKARPRGGGEHLSFLLGNEAIKPVGLHTSYVRVAQSLDELGKPVQNLIK